MSHPDPSDLLYLTGFNNTHSSEARIGALPRQQNTPQRSPYGLYPEQINGTAFTVQRALNQRTWFYRIRASVKHTPFQRIEQGDLTNDFASATPTPELMRWRPLPLPGADTHFVQGLHTMCGAGSPELRAGLAIHLYGANADMTDTSFSNADGDLLIAPEHGTLLIRTELGYLHVIPGEFAIIPAGLLFSVSLPDGPSRGYVLEVYNGHFRLPERGPIGANGLADERHFMAPSANFEDREVEGGFTLLTKFGGLLHQASRTHSPYDVVAWHGNYLPFKYDVSLFNSMGSVSFDHPDPSILTVLTVPRDDHGNACADVIFFPGRWEVAEHTFRPPYLHRNAAVEFSGIVKGSTDSKSGFDKGIVAVTPNLSAHGINANTFNAAIERDPDRNDDPHRIPDNSLWIMFESTYMLRFTDWALSSERLERDFRTTHEAYDTHYTPDER